MTSEYEFDLRQLALVLKRRIFLILSIVVTFVTIALVYLFVAAPLYKATTLIYIDNKTTNKVSDTSSLVKTGLTEGDVLSEAEVIVSGNVVKGAIKKLGWDENKSSAEIEELVLKITKKLDVYRVDKSYVVSLNFKSENAQEAANVANAVADSYMDEQVNALTSISKRTAVWLQKEVEVLRKQALTASEAAENYRSEYNSRSLTPTEGGERLSLTELQILDREAEAYRELHDNYLEKLKAADSQEGFPSSEARVITKASAPQHKDSPKPVLLLGMAIILGSGLGVFLALLIDNMDKGLKRIGQVKKEIGINFLGFIPSAPASEASTILKVFDNGEYRQLSLIKNYKSQRQYLNTIRTIKNEVDHALGAQKNKCFGIACPSLEETFPLCLSIADHISQSASCVVICPSLQGIKSIDNASTYLSKGLSDYLRSKSFQTDFLIYKEDQTMAILSPGQDDGDTLADFATTVHIKNLVDVLKQKYDYIIVNIPPLLAEAEAYGFIRNVDKMIIVGEWGRTKANDVNFKLSQNKIESDKILGLILTETDLVAMEKKYGHRFL